MYWRTQLRCQLQYYQHRSEDIRVTVGEDESVSVPPLGGFTVEVHVPRVENVGNSGHSL
jgi:hypothetical protein